MEKWINDFFINGFKKYELKRIGLLRICIENLSHIFIGGNVLWNNIDTDNQYYGCS